MCCQEAVMWCWSPRLRKPLHLLTEFLASVNWCRWPVRPLMRSEDEGEDRQRQTTASINNISRLEPETIHQAKVDPGYEKWWRYIVFFWCKRTWMERGWDFDFVATAWYWAQSLFCLIENEHLVILHRLAATQKQELMARFSPCLSVMVSPSQTDIHKQIISRSGLNFFSHFFPFHLNSTNDHFINCAISGHLVFFATDQQVAHILLQVIHILLPVITFAEAKCSQLTTVF